MGVWGDGECQIFSVSLISQANASTLCSLAEISNALLKMEAGGPVILQPSSLDPSCRILSTVLQGNCRQLAFIVALLHAELSTEGLYAAC